MEIASRIGGGGNDDYPRKSTWLRRLGEYFARRRLGGDETGEGLGLIWGWGCGAVEASRG